MGRPNMMRNLSRSLAVRVIPTCPHMQAGCNMRWHLALSIREAWQNASSPLSPTSMNRRPFLVEKGQTPGQI